MNQDNISVLRAIRIFNSMPNTKNGLSPLEIHYSFSADSLAFLSNNNKHPCNAKRKEINLKIRRVKEQERLKREKVWQKQNKNRKIFKGQVGDLCILRTKFQNKSKSLFGNEIWRIVQKHTYTALLARTSDNITQCRNAGDIRIVYSPLTDKKLPKEIVEKFDLVNYSNDTLRSQENLLVEPRVTRGQAKQMAKDLIEDESSSDTEDFDFPPDETPSSVFDEVGSPISAKKSVHFDPKVETRYIDGILKG